MKNQKRVAVIGEPSIGSTLEQHLQQENDALLIPVVVYEPTGKPENYNADLAFSILQAANKALGRDIMYTEATMINSIVKRDSIRIIATNGVLSTELVFHELESTAVVKIIDPTNLTEEQKGIIMAAAANHRRNVHATVQTAKELLKGLPIKKSGQQLRRERRAKNRKKK